MHKYFALFCLFLSSCDYFGKAKTQTLYFEGPDAKEAMLYKIQNINANQKKLTSIQKITTNSQNIFSVGNYLIVNECSSYEFQLKADVPTHIKLSPFHIKFLNAQPQNQNSKQNNTEIECLNRTTNEKVVFTNRDDFDILPGQNIIKVAGKKFLFETDEKETRNFIVTLNPLTIISPVENDHTQYFMQPMQDTSTPETEYISPLNVAYVNEPVWVNPGKYEIEINGTKSVVTVELNQPTQVKLGSLRIAQPKNFALSESNKSPSQPIFAYINKKILFSLDKDYAVFPNRYSVNLDNSDIAQTIEVSASTSTKIQTYGVQINPPVCPENSQNCVFSQKIFIYAKDQPYILTKVSMGVPFLVFQGEYQYSAEGANGIKKILSLSSDSIKIEHMAQLKLNWKLEISSNNLETRKIYIEPSCCGLIGKSEDLNSFRPREVFLPEGEYRVTSFVRQEKNVVKRNGTAIQIVAKRPNEVQIPIYTSGSKNNAVFLQETEDEDTPQGQTNLTPITQ